MMNKKVMASIYAQGIDPETLAKLDEEVLDPKYYDGRFVGDYAGAIKTLVSRFLTMSPIPDLNFRKAAIQVLTDEYIRQTGEVPDGVQLNLLANWLLYEDITDPHPDKVTREDYPIMNKGQLRTRHRRERVDEHMETRQYPASLNKKKITQEYERV